MTKPSKDLGFVWVCGKGHIHTEKQAQDTCTTDLETGPLFGEPTPCLMQTFPYIPLSSYAALQVKLDMAMKLLETAEEFIADYRNDEYKYSTKDEIEAWMNGYEVLISVEGEE